MELDIGSCKHCGFYIVINEGDEFPLCARIECFKWAFPDDWEALKSRITDKGKE